MKESFVRFLRGVSSVGKGKLFFIFSILFVFCSSLLLSSRGVNWVRAHPDENNIAKWMSETNDSDEHPYIQTRVYPEGLFVLGRLFTGIGKESEKISSRAEEWSRQSSLVYRERVPLSHHGTTVSTLEIRHWNVAFVALSAVFVFLIGCVILENIPVSILASMLYAFHPFVIEHAHYAETDAVMLFAGTLALLLMTFALKKVKLWIFIVGAFIAGFAVASKFSLTAIAFIVPVSAVVLGIRLGWKKWQVCLFAIGSLLPFAFGFLIGTPKLYLTPQMFFDQAGSTKRLTYAEMRVLLGESVCRPNAALVYKFRSILEEARKCSWLWWILCAGSIPLWFTKTRRQIFPVFPLFGLSYLVLAAFFFPWFRNQEFLPVLPFLSISAALPFCASLKLENGIRKVIAVTVSMCLLCAVVWLTFSAGMRMGSTFSAIETRMAASSRTGECAPQGVKYVFETYTCASFQFSIARNGHSDVKTVKKIETVLAETGKPLDCDYFFRTADMQGRGNVDPLTGKLYPSRQHELDSVLTNSVLLETWRILPGLRPMFAQPAIELYAYSSNRTELVDIPVPYPSPIVIKGGRYGYSGFRASSSNGLLGPTEAVAIVGKRKTVEFDPLPPGKKYYAVAVNLAGGIDADVEWSRGFSPLRQKVPAGRAALFTSTDNLSELWDAVPSAKVRMRGDDQRTLCIAVITPNPDVAARVLSKYGNDAAAREIADNVPVADNMPGKIQLDKVSFCGIPGKVVNDFSRFRSGRKEFLNYSEAPEAAFLRDGSFQYIELPYVLDEKQYRLKMSFCLNFTLAKCVNDIENGVVEPVFPECDLHGATLLSTKVLGLNSNGGIDVMFTIAGPRRYAPIYFGVKSNYGPIDAFKIYDAELSWDVTLDK